MKTLLIMSVIALVHAKSIDHDAEDHTRETHTPRNENEILVQNVASPNDPWTEEFNNIDEAELSRECQGHNQEPTAADSTSPTEIEEIRRWALECNVTHACLDKLLIILRGRLLPQLPKSSKTFLRTNTVENNITTIEDENERITGQYVYFGISEGLRECIRPILHTNGDIHLQFNVDGLPIFSSSKMQLWPILCRPYCSYRDVYKPFPVAIYSGQCKPSDANRYLENFVSEISDLRVNGIIISGKHYKVYLQCFICDTPARSFLKLTKGHGGFSACERSLKNTTFYRRVLAESMEVTAVAGHKARLPCDIDPLSRDEVVVLILWYREETSKEPIFGVDARDRSLLQAKLWSDRLAFGERATMRRDVKPAELQIDPLDPADNGVYRCRVDFKDSPTKNFKINLTVIVPPQTPIIFANSKEPFTTGLGSFNEGSELLLTCEVVGGRPPPRVAWYLENKLLDDTYRRQDEDVTVNQLTVTNVTREFLRAKLICLANNTHLVAAVTTEIVLEINLKPLEVNITNKRNHLSAVQTYDIECVTSGSRPAAVITWWKGVHEVKAMARHFKEGEYVTRSVLSYVITIEDDGKFLTCRAENPSVPHSALEDIWHLVVHYAPLVTIKFGSSLRPDDINEGDDVYFECVVKANPAAYKLGWYKNGKELHQNATAGIYLPGGLSLVLQRVTRTSAGEYSCMATNTEGFAISRSVTLEVLYAPICKDGSTAQVLGALKHETISLVCGVQSKPPPIKFHWTFNNSGELMNVPSNRHTQINLLKRHSSRLNYTPDDDMDYGTVSCSATNRIGVQRIPCVFQIIVAGKPYPLLNCTALQSTVPYAFRMGELRTTDSQDADRLTVKCNEGFDGGLPLTGFELEVYNEESVSHISTIYLNRTEKSNILGHHRGPIFNVPGLEPGKNYRLLLYAMNAKGRSDPVVLEPVSLKGVAMYTTGRGSTENSMDYSLLVACFTGGITAVCILVMGITFTLYRRNHPMQPIKTQTHIVHCENKDDRSIVPHIPCKVSHRDIKNSQDFHGAKDEIPRTSSSDPTKNTTSRERLPQQQQLQLPLYSGVDPSEENPDVIPNKVERKAVIFEPNYTPKIERTKTGEFREHLVNFENPSPSSVIHLRDTAWIYPNVYPDRPEETSPARPSTLPVHRTHDIYTRSSRVQESCI